jgi:hypothetical protein
MTPLKLAQDYVGRGWNLTPVEYRSKKPIGIGWQHRVIDAGNVAQYFNDTQLNIGAVLGPTSRNLTDVDEDADVAICIGLYILPKTKARFGRASKRDSHRLYYTDCRLLTGPQPLPSTIRENRSSRAVLSSCALEATPAHSPSSPARFTKLTLMCSTLDMTQTGSTWEARSTSQ